MFSIDVLAERLAALRKKKKWTQVDLAAKCDVNYATINKIESGQRKPSVPLLYTFCEVFNVSSDYLIGISDSPKRKRH